MLDNISMYYNLNDTDNSIKVVNSFGGYTNELIEDINKDNSVKFKLIPWDKEKDKYDLYCITNKIKSFGVYTDLDKGKEYIFENK